MGASWTNHNLPYKQPQASLAQHSMVTWPAQQPGSLSGEQDTTIPLSSLDLDHSSPPSLTATPAPSPHALLSPEHAAQLQHQGRLLLVSLLENFCSLYDRNPQKNQRLFLALCRKLSAMGILHSADFVDETVHVRAVYKRAFRDLVLEAIQGMRSISHEKRLLQSQEDGLGQTEESDGTREEDQNLDQDQDEEEEVTSLTAWSRYGDDFEELALLGRGGYGQVYQARNRIDDRLYAIKKLRFASVASQRFQRILREVKSLAHLDHPHIVRYHSAWIEESTAQRLEDDGSQTEDKSEDDEYEEDLSHAEPRLVFQPALMMYIQMELCHLTLADWLQQRNALIGGIHASPSTKAMLPPGMTCLLDGHRHEVSAVEARRILKAIVKALHYIHGRGMIHRDVKPQNIFFILADHHEPIPKLGDFGLVASASTLSSSSTKDGVIIPLSPPHSPAPTPTSATTMTTTATTTTLIVGDRRRTVGVGTELYASPEQTRGDVDYGERSDIYSLGIICFEMFHPMATQMERIRCLMELREHKRMPEELVRKWPKEAALIWSCLSVDPLQRPSAADILESGIFDSPEEGLDPVEALREENVKLRGQLMSERQERKRLEALVDRQGLLLEQLNVRMGQLEAELTATKLNL